MGTNVNTEFLATLFNRSHFYDYAKTESPIERFVIDHIIKFLSPDTQIEVQYPVKTISGNFRSDIALIKGDKIILLECDGKEHHTSEMDNWYDEWRDALILVQKKVSAVYRIKGRDIFNNIYHVFSIINYFDNDFFDFDTISRLPRIEIDGFMQTKSSVISSTDSSERMLEYRVEVCRKDAKEDFDKFWLKYVMYSLLYPEKNINELIEIFKKQQFMVIDLISMMNKKYPELNLQSEMQLLK